MNDGLLSKLKRLKALDIAHIFLFLLAVIPSLIYKIFHPRMWLICDNAMEARDNGYWLFKYIVQEHPECDVVYAIKKSSPDYDRVKDFGKVIPYGSFQHWIYYLAAKVNISSQKSGKPNAAVCYALEVYGILRNRRVFLQHGIIKDDIPFLHYENTKMRLFVCSTEREWRFVSERFGYPQGWVKNLGLCRLDRLHENNTIKKNQILVMPTWRSWIGTQEDGSRLLDSENSFTDTEYFKVWKHFLCGEALNKLLEQNNLELVFYPHRDMQRFIRFFEIENPHITVAAWPEYDVQTLLMESAYLITDYSSIAMDFAYMKKPLLYYQFDYEQFRGEHYPEGYFSYRDDGFGPVCTNEKEMLLELEKAIQRGFSNTEEYLCRHRNFFTLYDNHNCERNYMAVCELLYGKEKAGKISEKSN